MTPSGFDVVVPGPGATTPLGSDVDSTWEALLAGRSGVSRITDDWIKEFPAQLVARLASEPAPQIDRGRAPRPAPGDRPGAGPPARPQPAGRRHRRRGGLAGRRGRRLRRRPRAHRRGL